jgi:lipopolysaccharide transport system ATP-binding protein
VQRNGRPRYAIEFEDVSRRFILHHERRSSFQDWFISLIRPRGVAEEFWALRNVTFGLHYGETLGLVGRNGAGKSTLLKLVTRILEPSGGKVHVNGRTYAMLELGAGFHPELSGRDNIFLNGSLYGFSKREMARTYDDIVAFSELERFVDTPVKHYSSGMFARLAFGIAVNMRPEILVIDEVLAVGDAAFQGKCFAALEDLKVGGTTILLVSHDGDTVRTFCDRAALLVDGQLADIGPANAVIDHYEQLVQRSQPRFSLLRVRAVDALGLPLDSVQSGEGVTVEALLRVPEGLSTAGLQLEIAFDRMGGTKLWSTQVTLPAELPCAETASRRELDLPDTRIARLRIDDLPVAGDALHLVAVLTGPGEERSELIDRQETLLQVQQPDPRQRGLLALGHHWDWEATPPTSQEAERSEERATTRR